MANSEVPDLPHLEELILRSMPKDQWPNPEELYGLQIARRINEIGSGRIEIAVGTLYPTLRRLIKKGFLKSRWGDEIFEGSDGARRKYYKITDEGRRALQAIQRLRDDMDEGWKLKQPQTSPELGEAT